MRQQHFANGSVAVEVDALLLPPPAAALQAAGQAEEWGQLLLELTSPDGDQSWRAEQAVSLGPDGQAAACGTELPADEAAPGGGAAAVPQPVRRTLRVLVDRPQLWWPHDFGQQPLYQLRMTYTPAQQAGAAGSGSGGGGAAGSPAAEAGTGPAAEGSGAEAGGSSNGGGGGSGGSGSSSSLSRRIGLRRVELVTEALPGGAGETFFFRVNGQPVYARGETCLLHGAVDKGIHQLTTMWDYGGVLLCCDQPGAQLWGPCADGGCPWPTQPVAAP